MQFATVLMMFLTKIVYSLLTKIENLPQLYSMLRKGITCLLLFLIVSTELFAGGSDPFNDIKSMLRLPEKEIDMARAMLTIDKILDPSIDIEKYLKKIDTLVTKIIKYSDDPHGDILTMKKVLYEKGPWNNYQEYTYNLDDPFGDDLNNHLLSHYLDTKVGNCVSMPMLYYILGRKLGYHLYMSNAPKHMFVQAAVGKNYLGVEATRKGKSWPLEDFITQWEITEEAKTNKLYFQRLTKKEVISELLNQAIIHYMGTKQYKMALRTGYLAIKYYPRNYLAMINTASVYGWLIDDEVYLKGIVSPDTNNMEEYYKVLDMRYYDLRNKATQLGYRKFSKKEEAEILERIRRLKEGIENV